MARPKSLKPGYLHHKPSSRALVLIDGKPVYLGAHGSQESRDKYDCIIAEWISRGRTAQPSSASDPAKGITVSQVVLSFWKHATRYYGADSGELENFRSALKPLRKLYGPAPAVSFGPLALKALREHCIALGWARTYINKQMARVKQVFKWATAEELIPPSIHHGLTAVRGLKYGKTEAKESDPVKPVPEEYVAPILKLVSRPVEAMIRLQLLTGMRPGEVCSMRTIDVDTSGKPWLFKPPVHKTRHLGHERIVRIGRQAREILQHWLRPNVEEFIFRPDEAEAERRAKLHEQRVETKSTPLNCGNVPGSNRKHTPKRLPGDCFTVDVYRRCIKRACEVAFRMPAEFREPRGKKARAAAAAGGLMTPEKIAERKAARAAFRAEHVWHPHALRHNFATAARREYGLEMSQTLLGHRIGSRVSELYAEANAEGANVAAEKIG